LLTISDSFYTTIANNHSYRGGVWGGGEPWKWQAFPCVEVPIQALNITNSSQFVGQAF